MDILKKMDKTVVQKTTLHAAGTDFAYWQTQSPLVRWQTIELLRSQFHHFTDDDNQPRLQRVYRFTQLK